MWIKFFKNNWNLHWIERKKNTDRIDERNLVQYPGYATLVQGGATPHTAIVTQNWCKDKLPNFKSKEEWPGNSTDLNCLEKLWTYKGPCLTSIDQLRSLQRTLREMPKKIFDFLQSFNANKNYKNVLKQRWSVRLLEKKTKKKKTTLHMSCLLMNLSQSKLRNVLC